MGGTTAPMLLSVLLALHFHACASTVACPSGWTSGSHSSKCMKLSSPATHEGCAAECGAGASLACIQSEEDNMLAGMVAPNDDMTAYVWVGEYQYPFEPDIRFGLRCSPNCYADAFMGIPYNGQPNWGQCTNGQTTNYTPTHFSFAQPNNFNAGEDCMARSLAGFSDDSCNRHYPCLCEWASETSAAYTSEHGPALSQRANDATSLLYGNLWGTLALTFFLGSLPALCLVLVIEVYHIRWRQRLEPATPEEASLRDTIRIALRRRMRQAGLSLWFGGVLFALSIPSQPMFGVGAWPNFGCCDYPIGMPIAWKTLQNPGILLIMMTILPSETTAIRLAALAWPVYVAVMWIIVEQSPPFWRIATRSDAAKAIVFTIRGLGIALSLPSAVFWRRHALPGRVALRRLWLCIRLETLLGGVEFVVDTLPFMETPFASTIGTPMLIPAFVTIVFALGINTSVRRLIQAAFGGFGSKSSDSSAAMVVQTMVSGDALEAIRNAHDRLFTIKISALDESDMANNQDSGLFAKTKKVGNGECDAFLSHSWRDDAPSKWKKMIEFKSDYEAKHGGDEPRCWLDKACIDQDGDINASLRALPIYLLGSRYFVVFVGESYFNRMWCVLELFTFVRSGGTVDQIMLKPLHGDDAAAAISGLDIRSADCFLREDKQRILAIVEASYGSSNDFNRACRRILLDKVAGKGAVGSKGEVHC